MAANRLYIHLGRLLLAACITVTGLLASEHHGIVRSGGTPVPGATVTAEQGDKKVVTTTDEKGFYSFPELADGVWTISVEMLGFAKSARDVGVATDAPSPEWDLAYQTLEAITAPPALPAPAAGVVPAPGAATGAATTAAAEKAAETKTPAPSTPAAATPAAATPAVATAAATPAAKNAKKNAKNAKPATPATPATSGTNNGRPSLNAALAAQGQGGGFTRLDVNQAGGEPVAAEAPTQEMGDMAAAGNQSFTINGSVSSGLDMPQPGGDWFGGRGGMGGDMGGMGPGGMGPGGMGPGGAAGMGEPGGDPAAMAGAGGAGGGRGGVGGGGAGFGGGGGGFGGGGGRGGMGMGMPNIGGGRGGGGRGGAAGGRGGRNPGAFGNNRRDPRSRYNFAASLNNFTNSFLNARNFSETGQSVKQPGAQTLRSTLTAGGPLKIPHLFDTHGKGTFTINYSLTRNRNGYNFTDLVPTDAEKSGNFAGVTVNDKGTLVPVTLYSGSTPIPNNQIPANMISAVARALLKYYPEPNFVGGTATSPLNFSSSASGHTNGDNINARLSYTFNVKNQISGGIQWQRSDTLTPSVFGYVTPAWQDTTTNNGINANAAYIYHVTTRVIATTRYTYSKSTALTTPYFANLSGGNVAQNLGILGTDQNPIDWGPPSLGFSNGILGLSATRPTYSHPQTSAVGETVLWVRGAHQFQYGGDYSRRETNTLSQLNPRGSFSFTGAATALNGLTSNGGTGYDFADFLLGTPTTMSINVANSLNGTEAAQLSTATGSALANLSAIQGTPSGGDRYLRTSVYDLFANDNWQITPRISLSLGLRWDYQAPTTELYGRLATYDLPANFAIPNSVLASLPATTGASVVAGQVGPITGIHYSNSMLNGQKTDISPRFGFAWKPLPKHTLVLRGGWGLYYNPSVYSSLVGMLDAQTPFGVAYTITNNCGATVQNALSLPAIKALGCLAQNQTTTTNAMNPNFRVGYTQVWQMSVQTNLKWNTIATASYYGSKGTALPNTFYPNSFPNGGSLNCAAGYYCPNDFSYQTSNANSTDESAQFQLQRRLRSGLGGSASFTLNKAMDDQGTAQNWLDIAAERARTAGVRGKTANFSLQYSTGVGARGGALVNGFKGVLFKDWTVMPSLVLASGAPINVTDNATLIGGTAAASERVFYNGGPIFVNGVLNKTAFSAPLPGQYGNLGRDAITGPNQFSTSLSANRTFRLADRRNLTFSVQMQNPLNHPVVTGWFTSYTSPQFGAPSNYNGMRTLSASMRLNF
jgi:hypothetical protein